MNVPLEISFHQVEKTPEVEDHIRERAEKLERLCPNLSSCFVTVEPRRKREHPEFRVRIALTVPPSHEMAAETDPAGVNLTDLRECIRNAFDAAESQLKTLRAKQQRDVKRHDEQQVAGIIDSVFADDNYGFLRSAEGGAVYFHANSVVNEDFANVKAGMGVNYEVEAGDEGPQATSVRILDRR